jgi:hypothetical protein
VVWSSRKIAANLLDEAVWFSVGVAIAGGATSTGCS